MTKYYITTLRLNLNFKEGRLIIMRKMLCIFQRLGRLVQAMEQMLPVRHCSGWRNWDFLPKKRLFSKNILLYLQFTSLVWNINLLISYLKTNWILGLSKFWMCWVMPYQVYIASIIFHGCCYLCNTIKKKKSVWAKGLYSTKCRQ